LKTNAAKVKKTLAAVKFSKLTGILVHSSDFAFADNHIGNNLCLICWFDCLVGILLVPMCNVVRENPVYVKPQNCCSLRTKKNRNSKPSPELRSSFDKPFFNM